MSNYVTKSLEEQASDREQLAMYERIDREMYFAELQLTNKLVGIDTFELVGEADRKFSDKRENELKTIQTDGVFDAQHLKDVHEFLFQDIYYFAGEYRTLDMEIDSVTRFCPARQIEARMKQWSEALAKDNNLQGLDKKTFCEKCAKHLTELNRIHPFREGNGRSKRAFFTQLSKAAGYNLDWSACSPDEWKMADASAFDNARDGQYNDEYLRFLLNRAVSPMSSAAGNTKVMGTSTPVTAPTSPLKDMVKNMPARSMMGNSGAVVASSSFNFME